MLSILMWQIYPPSPFPPTPPPPALPPTEMFNNQFPGTLNRLEPRVLNWSSWKEIILMPPPPKKKKINKKMHE